MSTSGDGCSVHPGDIMMHVGGYHEYIRGYHDVHVGDIMGTCTHDIPPMYSWCPPDVLMNIPRGTGHTLYRLSTDICSFTPVSYHCFYFQVGAATWPVFISK